MIERLIAIVVLAVALFAPVQSTFGQNPSREDLINQKARDEMIAKGGSKLAPEDLRALLAGAVLTGTTWDGYSLRSEYKPDGMVNMETSGPKGDFLFDGKWYINENAQFCWSGTWRGTGGRWYQEGCQDLYKLDAAYYTISNGQILKREVKK